jgi:hypothetical protein
MRIPKFSAVFSLILLLAVSSCKEPEGIGLEVLPDGEEMEVAWIDTFTLEARTVKYDSVPTSGLNSGTYLVGDFGDPIFGRVRSELYSEFLLSSTGVDFGSGAVTDSIILNVAYAGAYGNTDKLNGTMKFGVYLVDEDLDATGNNGTVYYSNSNVALSSFPLAEFEFRPDLYSTIDTGDNQLPPSMRVYLSNTFGDSIINSLNLASQEIFAEEFEGICIKPINENMANGHGSILYFNMLSRYTQIELYYHNNDGDTAVFPFEFDNTHGIHTKFTHNFPKEVHHAVNLGTEVGKDRLYIQSMAGLRMKVDMPHLRELNKLGYVAINKAELVLPLDESVVTEYGFPNSLSVTGISEEGGSVFIIDQFEGSDYLGGVYDPVNKEYIFNVARHLQSIINNSDEIDYGLYIVNSGNAVNARRGVFNGPQHSTEPMKLRMTYTIIE